ncbi:hypothetical protein F5Y16DRAFT_200573 [Xylariaceae sp. FL0255]|nr:hypothetical protein F5Y16DRAFT_200573 [Xylariaceae sp. FL0255]
MYFATRLLGIVLAVAVGFSNVDALPLQADSASSVVLRDTTCTLAAINDCAASTGQTSTQCFTSLCVNKLRQTTVKRQSECTEDNLEICAIQDYEDPELCFEQLCLE